MRTPYTALQSLYIQASLEFHCSFATRSGPKTRSLSKRRRQRRLPVFSLNLKLQQVAVQSTAILRPVAIPPERTNAKRHSFIIFNMPRNELYKASSQNKKKVFRAFLAVQKPSCSENASHDNKYTAVGAHSASLSHNFTLLITKLLPCCHALDT